MYSIIISSDMNETKGSKRNDANMALPKHMTDAISFAYKERYSKEYSIVATLGRMSKKEQAAFKKKDRSQHDGMYTCPDSLEKEHGVTRCVAPLELHI